MSQQPDKFFKEKLESFQKAAPQTAWNKIETKLDKKNSKPFWLKIAASVIFLLTASAVFYMSKTNRDFDLITEIKPEIINNQNQLKDSVVLNKQPHRDSLISIPQPAEKKQAVLKSSIQTAGKIKKNQREQNSPERTERVNAFTSGNSFTLSEEEKIEQNSTETTTDSTNKESVVAANSGEESDDKTTSGVILVLSSEEVNEKYLNKNSLAEATRDEKKTSTLRKLLDKAYDLKHNQDPIGEFRQKKNEILALNFKNEKQRSQNR